MASSARADGQGHPFGFILTGGEASDYKAVGALLALPVRNPRMMLADKAYDADSLGHTESRPGDPIQLCLVSFTRDCGEADLPGRTYATGNLRTGAAWTLPDVRSSCVVR